MSSPKPPPAPDYAAAAQQTSAGNASQAQIAQFGSMTNQVTPYGQVNYTRQQVGSTAQGDPLYQWTQNVSLSPSEQAAFEQNNRINAQLGNVAEKGVGYVQQALANPLQGQQYSGNIAPTANQMVRYNQDPQLLAQNTADALYQANTQYLDPQFKQSNAQLANRLANQGITQGSEAYNNAMLNASNQQQQAYESARNAAVGGGVQAAQGLFGMGMQNAGLQNQAAQQAYQQALQSGEFQNQTAAQKFAQAQALQQNPLNILNAVRTGQQMQVANMPQVGQSNPAALQAVAGPDMLGAATAQGQYNMNTYNQQAAANNSMMGGLMQMGGMLGSAAIKASDRRLKKNIKRIGTHALGIGLYTWDYLWGQPFSGVMADEVEKVMPEAIVCHPSGFKMVNYSMLGII
jgi:hypothetical protein